MSALFGIKQTPGQAVNKVKILSVEILHQAFEECTVKKMEKIKPRQAESAMNIVETKEQKKINKENPKL